MKKTVLAILLGHLLFMGAPACSFSENDTASFEEEVSFPPKEVLKQREEKRRQKREEEIRWLREGKPRDPLDGKKFVSVYEIVCGPKYRIYFSDRNWIWDHAGARGGGKYLIDEAGQIQTFTDIQGFYDASSGKLIWAGQEYVPETEFFIGAPKDAREALEWSDAVFVGEAVEVWKDAFGQDSHARVQLDPDRIWKGKELPSKIYLYGDIWPIHSARIFIVGRKYLFYVNYQSMGPGIQYSGGRHEPFLIRVIPLEEAAEDINSLSAPKANNQ